jgi:endonuclease YncB( thermonuclease family)
VKNSYAFLLALLWVNIAAAGEFNAKVIVVIDGDTLVVLRNREKIKIRLANIDAPEKDQPYGLESRRALAGLVWKKQARIDTRAVDKYGRIVALVTVDGRNVNEEMVKRGMAWEYSYYKPGHEYIVLQSEAQQTRRGLWVQRSAIPPWQWRKTHPPVKWAGKHHSQ